MSEVITIQFGAGCRSGSTVDHTQYICVDVYDDEAVAFVDKIMDMIRTEAKRWDNINKEYERGEEE